MNENLSHISERLDKLHCCGMICMNILDISIALQSAAALLMPIFESWNSLVNDRAKRGILLAAAEWTFCDGTFEQTDLDKKCFEAIRWLCTESQKVEDDRNNVIHAPLQKDRFGQVMPASLFGNKRAKNLENKHLIEEYQRLRDTTRLLRNYAAAVHDPMCGKRVAWPNTPRLPDRAATKIPQPLHQAPLEEPLLRLKP